MVKSVITHLLFTYYFSHFPSQISIMNRIRSLIPLGLILLLATALRVSLLYFRGTLWFDELFSIHFSSLPWADALRYWALETNPPLYLFFLRFYLLLGDPANPFFTRLPALVFGLLGVVAVYHLGKTMFSKRA